MGNHRNFRRYKNRPRDPRAFHSDELQNAEIESGTDTAPVVENVFDADARRRRTVELKRAHYVSHDSRRYYVPWSLNSARPRILSENLGAADARFDW